MGVKSLRGRLNESTNIWPGFVDILATLLIVIIFILMIFTVSQIYLSDAISGRDKALEDLRKQINELSKILVIESSEKQKALSELESTQKELKAESLERKGLELEVEEKISQIDLQSLRITNLASEIQNLSDELRIVAKALETYEGQKIDSIEIKGLGERINKALASRIDELNTLNSELSKINTELSLSKEEITKQLKIVEGLNLELSELNIKLFEKEQALQNQVEEYQILTNDLIAINESLGLEDAGLAEQLNAIKFKNQELLKLNESLVAKETIIFDLRNKILELNNILSISKEEKVAQTKQITELSQKIKILQTEKQDLENLNVTETFEAEKKATDALEQVGILSNEIEILSKEISTLNLALEASERENLTKELKIEVLGERLNKALTAKVFELQKYRSEFFGRLQTIFGDRSDIKIVGDRFIFESELLFDSGSANLQTIGKNQLQTIVETLKETTDQIPDDINWIIQVEGHTDKRPINTQQFPSNWELSSARANTVLKFLLNNGFEPYRLSAAGYGEFYPLTLGESDEDYKQNRRIELKLTSR